jgi:hypothetical protein
LGLEVQIPDSGFRTPSLKPQASSPIIEFACPQEEIAMKKSSVLLAVLLLAAAFQGILSAADVPADHLANLVNEDAVGILRINSPAEMLELIAEQRLFKEEAAEKLLDTVKDRLDGFMKNETKNLGIKVSELSKAVESIKSISVCLKKIKINRSGGLAGAQFLGILECDTAMVLGVLKKLPLVTGTKKVGTAEVIELNPGGLPLGVVEKNGKLYFGDLASVVEMLSNPAAKPLAATADFKDAYPLIKDAAVSCFVNVAGVRKLLEDLSDVRGKSIAGLWKSLELDSVRYLAIADDLREGKCMIRLAGKEGRIWKMLDYPVDKSEAFACVPKDSVWYGRFAVGNHEDMLKKWAEWAAEVKDTKWGRDMGIQSLHKEYVRPEGDLQKLLRAKIREAAFYAFDLDKPPILVLRCAAPEAAKHWIVKGLGFEDSRVEHDAWKTQKKIKIEAYKDAEIYTYSEKVWGKVGHKEWELEKSGESEGAVALYKNFVIGVGPVDEVKKGVDAVVSGKNALAGVPVCTGFFGFDFSRYFEKDSVGRMPKGFPPLKDLFRKYAVKITVKKLKTGVDIRMNISCAALSAAAAAAAVPRLFASVKSGRETSGLASLKAIGVANAMYKRMRNCYAKNLKELVDAGYLQDSLTGGFKDGFRIIYTGGVNTYEVYAIPESEHVSDKAFFTDESCMIRFSPDGAKAKPKGGRDWPSDW